MNSHIYIIVFVFRICILVFLLFYDFVLDNLSSNFVVYLCEIINKSYAHTYLNFVFFLFPNGFLKMI